ncbi:PTS sugar transporter subunit IIA [Bifidobacterium crudilactis]|uniref:PTS sugar transporter subunit IIA n=1 Tax=Bifidobacterium crudilactis TaxID=327277 RepID=UPI0023557B61|nr:PTS sugar transporter subunit IIA [Bifidobacterium crudilactis]
MLNQFFGTGTVLYSPHVSGWEEAVDRVTRPLLSLGTIRDEYVEAIKTAIRSPGGTYIDLGYKIALAHARPEMGVLKTSLSVLHVAQSFLLADSPEHPISTMFCLAAESNERHLELMKELALLLSDAKWREQLESVSSEEELRCVFTGEEEES